MTLLNNNFYSLKANTLGGVKKTPVNLEISNSGNLEKEESVTLQAGTKVTEKDFNENWDNYKGWIYYVMPNGLAHCKKIRNGRCVEVRVCTPEKAENLY